MNLKAPFPWWGGKSRVSHIVWPRFGDTLNYVEPFAGSLAVLLKRPFPVRTETVNDKDAYLSNFWRALQHDPEAVAYHADWPVNEADLHARHKWLITRDDFREQMMSDPDYYDAKIAGWWVWGQCAWIGSGWCDTTQYERNKNKPTVPEQIPHLAVIGQGINRNGSARPNLRPAQGVQAIHKKRPQLSRPGRGFNSDGRTAESGLYDYMIALSSRLRRVRVTCGDWSRIMGPSVTYKIGVTAVFLDPPYNADANRQDNLYSSDDTAVSTAVREWAIENGDNPKLRIALCGYESEHGPHMPDNWEMVAWNAGKGYAGQNKQRDNNNGNQERIWFSPYCLNPEMTGIVDSTNYDDLFKVTE